MHVMTRTRTLIHTIFLFLLPLIVVWFGFGVATTLLLILLALLWRWAIVISGLRMPEKGADLTLETIAPSHFVEKVRWSLDRLGVDYDERQCGGTLGAFFTGRTVPQLRVRTGVVQSVIGNSPEILRFLWGNYSASHADSAGFLEPNNERLELEQKLDRYARFLQVWSYYHLLPDRNLTLKVWGVNSPRVPLFHRLALRITFPLMAALVRNSFRITDDHYARAVSAVDHILADIDVLLADGRRSILGGDQINYTDLTFAAYCGLWMQPDNYANGAAEDSRPRHDDMPAAMRADIDHWIEDHPKATGFVARLYAEER